MAHTQLQGLHRAHLVLPDLNVVRLQHYQSRAPRDTIVLVGLLFAVFALLVTLVRHKLRQSVVLRAFTASLVLGLAPLVLLGIHARIHVVPLKLVPQARTRWLNQPHARSVLQDHHVLQLQSHLSLVQVARIVSVTL